jgi:hypothetical protein
MGLSVNQSGTRAYITGLTGYPFGDVLDRVLLYVLDIQDPSQPTELGRYNFGLRGRPSSPSMARPTSDGALVVFADHSWGLNGGEGDGACGILHILDTANPAAISKISSFALPQSSGECSGGDGNWIIATDLVIRGDMVYSTWLRGGVRAVDISDPANPIEVGAYVDGNTYSDIDLLGDDYVVVTPVWDSGMVILRDDSP